MIMKRNFFIIIILQCLSLSAVAFEPPRETIQESMANGETAFLARAVKTNKVDERKYETTANVELEVLYCFYGADCTKGDTIRLGYIIKTIKESTLPVQFPLGTDIVFILSHGLGGNPNFDSEWRGGIDRAFICDNYPSSILNSNEKVRCKNIYGGKKSLWVKWDELLGFRGHR